MMIVSTPVSSSSSTRSLCREGSRRSRSGDSGWPSRPRTDQHSACTQERTGEGGWAEPLVGPGHALGVVILAVWLRRCLALGKLGIAHKQTNSFSPDRGRGGGRGRRRTCSFSVLTTVTVISRAGTLEGGVAQVAVWNYAT